MKARISFLSLFFATVVFAQTSNNTWSVKFSNAMLYRYQPTINALTAKGWEYSNTIITHGMEKVYNKVPDSTSYLNYIQAYVDTYVNGSGVISATVNSLDRTHPGISCLFLYEKTGLLKYRTAATTLKNIYVGASATYPKTTTGNIFWHKNNGSYNDIILIDGIYMLHPFLAKYGSMFNDAVAIDTAVNQTLFIYNQLYDNSLHLIKHAWNPTKTQSWANATTGNSGSVWSRGMGWYCMALVDILKYVPASHPRRSELITALNNLAIGIQTYKDPVTGLWYQVVDKRSTLAGNFIETSGSAMFIYTLKTAVDSGWISNSYLPVAQAAWTYLKNTVNGKVDLYSDSYARINGFAPAMSVQTSDANYVQASLQPVSAPGTAHPHGYGAILMAASVMEFPLTFALPLQYTTVAARHTSKGVAVSWQHPGAAAVYNFGVQRSNNNQDFITITTFPATSASQYSIIDNEQLAEPRYYRIKATAKNGEVGYSKTVFVNTTAASKLNLSVAPNPVTGGVLKINYYEASAGVYQLQLFNSNGYLVIKKSILPGEATTFSATINVKNLPAGIYHLSVIKDTKLVSTSSVVIQ